VPASLSADVLNLKDDMGSKNLLAILFEYIVRRITEFSPLFCNALASGWTS
jgi:hypothetical protein